MDRDEAAFDRVCSIDGYAQRRLRLAGGSLFTEECPDQNPIDELKQVYLQPLDTIRANFERSGGSFVSFATYDYAGVANDVRVKRAACDAIMQIGIGAGASRLVGGERAIHSDL